MTGSLATGKQADLIVLDQNLFGVDLPEIHNTRVVLTMMGGVVGHRDGI